MNKRIKKKKLKMENKRLCERYPFLQLRNPRTDKLIKSDYYTNLDEMPNGWRKAFGQEMCEEIRKVLIKGNYLYDYRVVQIKEKFGALRWYDNGAPDSIYRELQDIINKYEEISERTCIWCGRPATKISLGWISPWCDNCAEKMGGKFRYISKEPLVF